MVLLDCWAVFRASIQPLNCCSSAAHPAALYPDDAQHPIASVSLITPQRKLRYHTQHAAHDAQTWIRFALVRFSHSELW